MEAFLAVQALYGGDNSDSESVRSDISESFGALSFQRRPGTGRRKKQVPWRSPWDASINTDYAPQYMLKEHLQSRLGITDPQAPSSPETPTAAEAVADDFAPIISATNPGTPNSSKSKKSKQDLAGPCCHCNATNSPQWRKGPKGKPILCNACGIRFLRTRTLGKAMPKKRHAPAAGGQTGRSQTPKRLKTDEPSTEEDDFELATDEVLAAEDAIAATDDGLEEARSENLTAASLALAGLAKSSPAAAAAATGHQIEHPHQHSTVGNGNACYNAPMGAMPTSRLAIASSAAVDPMHDQMHDEYPCTAAEGDYQHALHHEQAATDAHYTEQYAQQYSQGYEGRSADNAGGERYNAPECTAAATAASALAGLFPQYGWPATSLHPLGPRAAAAASEQQHPAQDSGMLLAAAARAAGTSSSGGGSSSSSMFQGLSPMHSNAQQPLAAGSKLLLNAGSSSGSRLAHNPSLALALAMHQQQQHNSSNAGSQQQQLQQPQSPLKYGLLQSAAAAAVCGGSPMSHSSAFHPHLRAEFSGFSLASGSPPASPLMLGAAAGAAGTGSSNAQHLARISTASGGSSSVINSQQHYGAPQQQQQHGLHGPSPLSVMATAADLAPSYADLALQQQHADLAMQQRHADVALQQQHADLAMQQRHADVALQQQHADLAMQQRHADLAASTAAPAAAAAQPAMIQSQSHMLQLMQQVASAFGSSDIGHTWDLITCYNGGSAARPMGGRPTAMAGLGLQAAASIVQQQQ